ncbi:hypothetical protein SERLA73DRAFT_132239, partial [Serpula lacrymans var. lacrymans S7.3]
MKKKVRPLNNACEKSRWEKQEVTSVHLYRNSAHTISYMRLQITSGDTNILPDEMLRISTTKLSLRNLIKDVSPVCCQVAVAACQVKNTPTLRPM